MNKNDLVTTLGSIRAPEELIRSTMARIDKREAAKENKGFFRMGTGFRVAFAACALALVIGLGIYGGITNPPIVADDNLRVASEDDVMMLSLEENDNSYGIALASSEIDELLCESENIDGDWAIVSGTTEACYFAGGEEGAREFRCVIAVSLKGVETTSGGIAPTDKEMSFELVFPNENEMNEFINNCSAQTYFLVAADERDGNTAWVVKKFITKN